MLIQKNVSINGIDCSSIFTAGYEIRYEKRRGNNGGMMLDGSTTVDVLAVKAIITLPMLPLAEINMQELITALTTSDYVTVTYWDLRAGKYRTIQAEPDELSVKYLFRNIHGDELWKTGGSVVLTER